MSAKRPEAIAGYTKFEMNIFSPSRLVMDILSITKVGYMWMRPLTECANMLEFFQ